MSKKNILANPGGSNSALEIEPQFTSNQLSVPHILYLGDAPQTCVHTLQNLAQAVGSLFNLFAQQRTFATQFAQRRKKLQKRSHKTKDLEAKKWQKYYSFVNSETQKSTFDGKAQADSILWPSQLLFNVSRYRLSSRLTDRSFLSLSAFFRHLTCLRLCVS